ncbi:MAG: 50S ribosome-binding GTPase [Desulfurococcales archaeon]|nr:50S ribosome-binding GTPase [Desulfurococcales archaeon]
MDPREAAKRIHVPMYSEILERIRSRYPRKGRPLEREIARIQTVRNIIIDKTSFIRDLVRLLDNLHPFYWRLIEIEYDRRRIHEAISCISKSRKLVSSFWEKYRILLLASETPRELRRTSEEARGRMLSTIKRCSRGLELLRSLVVFLQHLPSINPSIPTIIIAGPPSTGKSTLVRQVSTGKPEVAPYPFTTKNIHIGHIVSGDRRIQVIDTPGLLDRSPDEMNPIERRAVAALTELEGAILYLVDPTPTAYMGLDDQYRLFIKIHRYTRGKRHYLGINKVDTAPSDLIARAEEKARDMVERGLAEGYYKLSAINAGDARRVIQDIITKTIPPALQGRP